MTNEGLSDKELSPGEPCTISGCGGTALTRDDKPPYGPMPRLCGTHYPTMLDEFTGILDAGLREPEDA